jgi:hypothetical protein
MQLTPGAFQSIGLVPEQAAKANTSSAPRDSQSGTTLTQMFPFSVEPPHTCFSRAVGLSLASQLCNTPGTPDPTSTEGCGRLAGGPWLCWVPWWPETWGSLVSNTTSTAVQPAEAEWFLGPFCTRSTMSYSVSGIVLRHWSCTCPRSAYADQPERPEIWC